MHKFKSLLSDNQIAYGVFSALKDPAIVEILGYTGYDFVIIDLEHSALDLSIMENMIRAAKIAGISSVVRTPQNDNATILRAVEAGADAVMVPHVDSKEKCEKIVSMAKYYPMGSRGIDSSTRAAKYGNTNFSEHLEEQNNRVLVIGMIESVKGVDNIDDIVAVKGLDLLFVGAADLSGSLGMPGQVAHPEVRASIKKVIRQSQKAGIKVGLGAYNADQVSEILALGAEWVTSPVVDTLFISENLKNHLSSIKGKKGK